MCQHLWYSCLVVHDYLGVVMERVACSANHGQSETTASGDSLGARFREGKHPLISGKGGPEKLVIFKDRERSLDGKLLLHQCTRQMLNRLVLPPEVRKLPARACHHDYKQASLYPYKRSCRFFTSSCKSLRDSEISQQAT